jgi:hypothetical protein
LLASWRQRAPSRGLEPGRSRIGGLGRGAGSARSSSGPQGPPRQTGTRMPGRGRRVGDSGISGATRERGRAPDGRFGGLSKARTLLEPVGAGMGVERALERSALGTNTRRSRRSGSETEASGLERSAWVRRHLFPGGQSRTWGRWDEGRGSERDRQRSMVGPFRVLTSTRTAATAERG